MFYSQQEFDIKCEWGAEGLEALVGLSDAVVIVDVLSFSTCVDIATARGAVVYPYRRRDESAVAFAASVGAVLAGPRQQQAVGYSLAPTSLVAVPPGTRLVLPSPNGSTLTLATGDVATFAGCLRNASVVAYAASAKGSRVSVIPAGERWEEGGLRPAIEDLLGAGAIIHNLPGTRSPEASAAEALFLRFKDSLPALLAQCSSGKELIEAGFEADVELAALLDVSNSVPFLIEGAYSW